MTWIFPSDGGSVELQRDAFGVRLNVSASDGHPSVVLRDEERHELIRLLEAFDV